MAIVKIGQLYQDFKDGNTITEPNLVDLIDSCYNYEIKEERRFDFNGTFLVYPTIWSIPPPENIPPLITNPTLQEVIDGNEINSSPENMIAWVDLIVAGGCGILRQVLEMSIKKVSQIIEDLVFQEDNEVQWYQQLYKQYVTIIDDGQRATPPADVSGVQSVLADLTAERAAANQLYNESRAALQELQETYTEILQMALARCGAGDGKS